MQPQREAPTAPRARRGARRRGPAAIAAAMVCVSLAVAASAPAGSAAERASIEAPAAASILGGPGGILGVGPESGAADPRRRCGKRTRARAAVGGSGDRVLPRGRRRLPRPRLRARRPRLRQDRRARRLLYRRIRKQRAAGRSSATTSTPESDSTGSSAMAAVSAGSISPARREPSLPRSTTGAASSARTPTSAGRPPSGPPSTATCSTSAAASGRIDVPGAIATRPEAINSRGQIAGEYVDRAGILPRLPPGRRRLGHHHRPAGRGRDRGHRRGRSGSGRGRLRR